MHMSQFLTICSSPLRQIPLPSHAQLRSLPAPLPLRVPEVEDKIEFGDGSMACVSKGGFKAGEAARKVELARKGLL